MSGTALEVRADDWVVILDSNVLEVFVRGGTACRIHVGYLRIEGKDKKDGLKLAFGRDIGHDMTAAEVSVTVPTELRAELDVFLAELKARKDAWVAVGQAR